MYLTTQEPVPNGMGFIIWREMGKFVKTDTTSVVWVMGINDKKYPITDENGKYLERYN